MSTHSVPAASTCKSPGLCSASTSLADAAALQAWLASRLTGHGTEIEATVLPQLLRPCLHSQRRPDMASASAILSRAPVPAGCPRGDRPAPKGSATPAQGGLTAERRQLRLWPPRLPPGSSRSPRAPRCWPWPWVPPLPATLSSAPPEHLILKAAAQLSHLLPGNVFAHVASPRCSLKIQCRASDPPASFALPPESSRAGDGAPRGRCLSWGPAWSLLAGEGPGVCPWGGPDVLGSVTHYRGGCPTTEGGAPLQRGHGRQWVSVSLLYDPGLVRDL